MNLALFDSSIISFVVAQFKKETGLPVSTVSCIIWLSILTMVFNDFTLFDIGSRRKSIFLTLNFSPFNFWLFSLILSPTYFEILSFSVRCACIELLQNRYLSRNFLLWGHIPPPIFRILPWLHSLAEIYTILQSGWVFGNSYKFCPMPNSFLDVQGQVLFRICYMVLFFHYFVVYLLPSYIVDLLCFVLSSWQPSLVLIFS